MRKSTLSICISLSLICLLALPVTFNQAGSKVRGIAAETNSDTPAQENEVPASLRADNAQEDKQINFLALNDNLAEKDIAEYTANAAKNPSTTVTDTPKQNEVKNDQIKKDEVKKDEVKKDEVKKDEVKKDETKKAKEKEELEKKNKERLADAENAVKKAEQAYDEAKDYYDDVMADPYASNSEVRKAKRDLEKAKNNLRKADKNLVEVERDVKKSEGRYYSRRHERNYDRDLTNDNMAYLLSYWMLMQNNANYALGAQGVYNQMPTMGYGLDLNAQAQWAHLNNGLGPVAQTINYNYYGAQHNYYGLDLNQIPSIGRNVIQTYNFSINDSSIRDYSKVIQPQGNNDFQHPGVFEREPASRMNVQTILPAQAIEQKN